MAKRLRSKSSQTLHFSFGHDVFPPNDVGLTQVTVLPVLTALGVFPPGAGDQLGTKAIEWSRIFRVGNIVPFCGNVAIEKLHCGKKDFVRVLNNQVPGIRPLLLC